MRIKYRIGIMPGPWPAGRESADCLWTLCEFCERSEEYVKGGASKFILRPLCPPVQMLDQLATVAEQIVPAYHSR